MLKNLRVLTLASAHMVFPVIPRQTQADVHYPEGITTMHFVLDESPSDVAVVVHVPAPYAKAQGFGFVDSTVSATAKGVARPGTFPSIPNNCKI